MANQTVRKRVCRDCGNIWFTAEIIVPSFAVGWSPIGKGGSKPVVRVPMDVTLEHIETDDKKRTDQCAATPGDDRPAEDVEPIAPE